MKQNQRHPFVPIYNKDSAILILGTFPSVKSRENEFYYGHPQNRFWKVLSAIYNDTIPQDIESKKAFLLSYRIAVWDVIASCDIEGSSDSSIQNVVPNDILSLMEKTNIQTIYCKGKKAQALFDRYIAKHSDLTAEVLPSTSPANAAWTLEKLIEQWKIIIKTTG